MKKTLQTIVLGTGILCGVVGCEAFDPTKEEKLLHETTVGNVKIRIINEIRVNNQDVYRTEIAYADGKVKATIVSSDLDYGTNIQSNDGKKYHMKDDKRYYKLPKKSDEKKVELEK